MRILLILCAFFPAFSWGTFADPCQSSSYMIGLFPGQYQCAQYLPTTNQDCIVCQQQQQQYFYQLNQQNFLPANLTWQTNSYPMPWWAIQGRFSYPNFNYPGAWQGRGINQDYYPGQGSVFAAKPNVYIENKSGKLTTFRWNFLKKQEFLVTTPKLEGHKSWSGLVTQDSFRVENVGYDYLFYDLRLPLESTQFEKGYCVNQQDLIAMMISELQELKYPAKSVDDFYEHWPHKIPQYPHYCVYPQFNDELDKAIPVAIFPAKAKLVRTLFVVVPYQKMPRDPAQAKPLLPTKDHRENRPLVRGEEFTFYEWGVAFLASDALD